MEPDTIALLKECDAGAKMAVSSIDEVLPYTSSNKLLKLLNETHDHHEELGNRLHKLLDEYDEDEKEPNPIAKSMSWMKTNVKLVLNESDSTIADLITEGCDMGIRSLYKYYNKYDKASKDARKICTDLIEIEDKLRRELTCYL